LSANEGDTTAKEEEFKKREQALTEKEETLNQQLQEAAAAKEAQLSEREQALVESRKGARGTDKSS
jgi:hypothetical protein